MDLNDTSVFPLSVFSLHRNTAYSVAQQNYWPATMKATNSRMNSISARSLDLRCDAFTEETGKTNLSVVGCKAGLHRLAGIAWAAF